MAPRGTVLSLVLALVICRALAGAVPEQVLETDDQQGPGTSKPLAITDTLKQLWDTMEPNPGKLGDHPPPSDHDKYEMVKNLQLARNVRGDKCNRSALASLNNLADVAAHLYSDILSDYVSFYRNRQFNWCKGPAIEALRKLLTEDEAQQQLEAGDAARLAGIVELGERIRRQGKKHFGSTETRKALVMYLHEKGLHPWENSGGHKTNYYVTMDQLFDNMCRGTLEPRVIDTLDVLEQLHGDHSLSWDEFHSNEIDFIVGSIACRDILEDKQAYIGHLYTISGDNFGLL